MFKVKAVGNEGKSTGTWQSKKDDATMYTFTVKIEGDDRVMEVSRKSDKPPDIGAEYEKLVEPDNPQHKPKLQKPVSKGGGGYGGGRAGGGYSPQDIAAMRRSGAFDRAIAFMAAKGVVPFIDTTSGEVEVRCPDNAIELETVMLWFEGKVNEAVAAVPAS